jgi:hypothetical protein
LTNGSASAWRARRPAIAWPRTPGEPDQRLEQELLARGQAQIGGGDPDPVVGEADGGKAEGDAQHGPHVEV